MANLNMDLKRMYAIWRVDAPWRPCTKRHLNSRMGGGRPEIKFFSTPVRQDRILMELNGNFEFEEVRHWLKKACNALPILARPVSQEMLEEERAREAKIKRENLNIFDLDTCIKSNFNNCQKWFSVYNQLWGGKYR